MESVCLKDVVLALMVLLATLLLSCAMWMVSHNSLWQTPRRVKHIFGSQGIANIPGGHFFSGNLPEIIAMTKEVRARPMPHISHDIVPHVLPHYHQWSKKYGDKFVYWLGAQLEMFVTDVEDGKEVLSKFAHYPRPSQRPDMVDILDNGLAGLNGERWALHRRILTPAFFSEKLKVMFPTMVACTTEMIQRWDSVAEGGQNIDVDREFKTLTADIIAHTAFGINYGEGKQVFELQHEQFRLADIIGRTVYIPGARFVPTPFNRLCWKVDNEIDEVLRRVIEKRLQSREIGSRDTYGKDLLGLLLAANKSEGSQSKETLGMDDIIGECKTFFLAGHETTSTLLTWTCLLLAIYPEWQERAREEVQAICGATDLPTTDSVNHLKLVGMVLNEALRLYTPAPVLTRKAASDMQLGKTMIPKGTVMVLPIIAWHHDQRYWGPDVNEFRPERFSEGAAKACKVAGAFAPFSMAPANCIGQTFALLEAKAVLSMILQHYRFHRSPAYRHAPTFILTLQPLHGVPLMFEKL